MGLLDLTVRYNYIYKNTLRCFERRWCYTKKADIFWQTYLNLEKEAIDLSKYVYITDEVSVNLNGSVINQTVNSQLETFSPYIADLLVSCCIQIESISKEIYFENGGQTFFLGSGKMRNQTVYKHMFGF